MMLKKQSLEKPKEARSKMAKPKACRKCRLIFEGDKCPKCDSKSIIESFKGKIEVFNPEQSEIAKNLKLTEKGSYAIKSE